MSFIFDTATANIQSGLEKTQAQSDVDKIVAIADVIGFQEIKWSGHREVVDSIPGWSKHAVWASEDGRYQPIAWKDSVWSLVSSGGFQIYAGDTTHGLPPRWVNWVILERAASAGGPQKIRFVNTHFTAGMNYENSTPTDRELAARAGWQTCWDNMNAQIDSWMAGGYTPMVLTGDYNCKVQDFPKFAAAQEYDTPGQIDHISHIPNSKFDPVKDVTDLNGDVTEDRFYTDHGPDIWRIKFL